MIKATANYFKSIPPVFIDGALYALIAWFTFNQSYLGGDEAAKYIDAKTKFILNWVIGSGATIFASIKMFRSTTFSEHREEKKKNGAGDTQIISKS
jgi:hypothetical protein